MNAGRERLIFWAGCALLWTYLAVLAWLTPVLLDDWYQLAYIKKHGLSPGSVLDYGVYNYFNYNPRLGENFLLITNGPRIINVVLTPTVILGFLWVCFAIALGRWPRPSLRDLQLLLLQLALIWLAAPIPGVLFAYRPFCTNYLYALAFSLAFLVPYRFAVDRAPELGRRWWWMPLMFAAGWIAGMGNEHTGPTIAVAAGVMTFLYWRHHRRVHAWMVTGLAGIAIGYPMLFFAPGQKKRYGAVASKLGPTDHIRDRGPNGLFEIIIDFLWAAQLAVFLVLVGAFVALASSARAGSAPPSPDRRITYLAAGYILCAGAIIVTLFASPTASERLFFAPAVFFAMAGLVLLHQIFDVRAVRRTVVAIAGFAVAAHATWGLVVYIRAHAEGAERERILERTPRDQVALVPPYTQFQRNLWFLGDDFDYASLREYVAREVYGIAGIEFTRPVKGEPAAEFSSRIEFVMDPPMSNEEVWSHVKMPLSYVSAYPDRVIQLVQRILPQLQRIPGHRLVSITSYVEGLDLPERRGRPLIGMRWENGEAMYIDTFVLPDSDMRLYFLALAGTVPPGLTDAYVRACGQTKQVETEREWRGVRLPYVPWCRGLYMGMACNPTECWLSGVYWR
ncbi:MAG: hypothetical protein F9K40_07940 [Kofleriaceae bacterium]|nr:MAG: hypothetical protein F9K40_07940 [Kofleriaceae bacterium]MBZ0231955.1 DUF6056 family protein [Kofleriaceae bacterium]